MTGEEKDVQKGGSMPRAPSVDDLFVPMGRLDMHSSGMGADNEEVKEGGNTSASNVCGSSSLVHSATAEKTPSASDGEYVVLSSRFLVRVSLRAVYILIRWEIWQFHDFFGSMESIF